MKNFRIYFRIVHFAKPYWKHISLSVLCTVLYSIFSGASIGLFIPLLDLLFHPEKINGATAAESFKIPFSESFAGIKQSFFDFVFSQSQTDALLKICIIIVAAFLLKNFFGYMQSFLMNYAEEGVIKDIRNAAYKHLHDLPLGYFTNERTGDLISRIMNDVQIINGGISAMFVTLIREPLLVFVFLSLAKI